ncbi:MAG TPA: hypothetical protein VGQ59_00605 [Cyclobacteriaceae bacterium]|jgi:predicted nucleic acid-binding Zn ribbon protein|nr:hypothetical protein [Cyclobacteriaceae bacterium]
MEDDHNQNPDDMWVESDTYQPNDVHENKKRRKKDQFMRIVIILFLVLLAILLSWIKN